jgi:hypothetical protein
MSHIEPDGQDCKNYFKYGKSFPDNVKDALCEIPFGATGPTGPAGPVGSGVYQPAQIDHILEGNNNNGSYYVDAEGWYAASNRYAPLVTSDTVGDETYTPDAYEYNIFDLTLEGDTVIAAPTNMKNGRTISLVLRQGGYGNHTVTWDPSYHFDGGYNSITFTQGAKDVVVATMINDFLFTTIASDCKASD